MIEDRYPQSRYNPQAPPSAGWMANRASGSAQLGATKRSGLTSHDRDGSTKKFKADVALPPMLGEFFGNENPFELNFLDFFFK